jgi:hypothetical protein
MSFHHADYDTMVCRKCGDTSDNDAEFPDAHLDVLVCAECLPRCADCEARRHLNRCERCEDCEELHLARVRAGVADAMEDPAGECERLEASLTGHGRARHGRQLASALRFLDRMGGAQ